MSQCVFLLKEKRKENISTNSGLPTQETESFLLMSFKTHRLMKETWFRFYITDKHLYDLSSCIHAE